MNTNLLGKRSSKDNRGCRQIDPKGRVRNSPSIRRRLLGLREFPYRLVRIGGLIALAVCTVFGGTVEAEEVASLPLVLVGKLVHSGGTDPVLITPKKRFSLRGAHPYLTATLWDEHLRDRQVRLEGIVKEGVLEVARIFTVQNGQVFKVRYFCEVCNITDLKPGICVCCQAPTEFREIPATKENDWR